MGRAIRRLAGILAAAFVLLVVTAPTALATAPAAAQGSVPAAAPTAAPPDPIPEELEGLRVGIDRETGEYCNRDDPDAETRERCRPAEDCEQPGTTCSGEGDPEEGAHQAEIDAYEEWLEGEPEGPQRDELAALIQPCVEVEHRTFRDCALAAFEELDLLIDTDPDSLLEETGGAIQDAVEGIASSALENAAAALGESVVWTLEQFAEAFNSVSTIQLSDTGIGPVIGITWGISALVAVFLLLMQFGKVAISQQGAPFVTAITGLAKWGIILSVYLTATQVALDWSDTLSSALINYTFDGGGETEADATEAMKQQLGTLFSGLFAGGTTAAAGGALITGSGVAAGAIGFVLVISILCILAIGALWVEMLIRQAAIMVIVCVMPIVLAGQMADATQEWWPKARNALIAMILMKPVIVLCFSIGFTAMSGAEGVRNVIVGLIIFILAGFAWPTIARFMTFTSNGEGNSAASGLFSSIGSSFSSRMGGPDPALSGAGLTGGGGGYTRALEADNSNVSNSNASSGGQGFWSKAIKGSGGGSFGSKVGASVGLGMQVAAVGKDVLESGMQSAAANAGLGPGGQGGRHVVISPRNGSGGSGGGANNEQPPPTPTPSTPEAPPQPPQAVAAPSEAQPPPSRPPQPSPPAEGS